MTSVSKEALAADLLPALQALARDRDFAAPSEEELAGSLEPCRDPAHGDWALAIAMRLAKRASRPPRELAEAIAALLRDMAPPWLAQVEVAGPGFINLRLAAASLRAPVLEALRLGAEYGTSPAGSRESVLVEFVSANPTGPLHLGHGRNAVLGDALSRLLHAAGHEVATEYYVNDAGRQLQVFGMSLWLRWLGFAAPPAVEEGEKAPPVQHGQLPRRAYLGEYLLEMLDEFQGEAEPAWKLDPAQLQPEPAEDPEDELQNHLDAARAVLGEGAFDAIGRLAARLSLQRIKGELQAMDVQIQQYVHERALVADGALDRVLQALQEAGATVRREGALWLRSQSMGDDKDRVLVRSNGEATYFAVDLAYHLDKIARGHQRLVDVWGADHHGYVARMQLGIQALRGGQSPLRVLLVQLVSLLEGGRGQAMSKRAGNYVTLAELRERIGADAVRYYYLANGPDRQQEVDVELAARRSTDNPVFYLQYAHARLCSIANRHAEEYPGEDWDDEAARAAMAAESPPLDALASPAEEELLRLLDEYPRVLAAAAEDLAPQRVLHFLNRLAAAVHGWYKDHRVVGAPDPQRRARMALAMAARQVLANGLGLLGIRAPAKM